MKLQGKLATVGMTMGLVISLFFNTTAWSADVEKSRTRIEELFLWKVSDALGLDSKQEVEFTKIMKKVREDKLRLDNQMNEVLRKMDEQKDEKVQATLLEEYKGYLKDYNASQMREVEQLEKLLGTQKVAKYLSLKEKLVTRLKGALAESSQMASAKTKGKQPKIIHEE
jgi:hypothetical protein